MWAPAAQPSKSTAISLPTTPPRHKSRTVSPWSFGVLSAPGYASYNNRNTCTLSPSSDLSSSRVRDTTSQWRDRLPLEVGIAAVLGAVCRSRAVISASGRRRCTASHTTNRQTHPHTKSETFPHSHCISVGFPPSHTARLQTCTM